MFDRIVEQSGNFGLSQAQGRQLVGLLVARIFSPRHGGPAGFIAGLRHEGLGREADSWLGPDGNLPITEAQVERLIDTPTLARISERLGAPPSAVVPAAAAILPEVVHELSEHGDLPATAAELPPRANDWIGNLQGHLADLGTAALDAGAATLGASVGVVGDIPNVAPDAAAGLAPQMDRPVGTEKPGNPARALAVGLAVLVALLLGFALIRGCSREARAPASGAAAPQPGASIAHMHAEATHLYPPPGASAGLNA